MIIRRAKKSDIEAMARVVSESWQVAYKELISDEDMNLFSNTVRRKELFRKNWDGQLNFVLLCENSVKGVCSAKKYLKDGFCDAAEIDQLYLDPDHIGQGCGKRLLDFVLFQLKEEGFKQAILYVMEGNEKAIGFYERCGFKPDGNFSVCENLSRKNRGLRYTKTL